MGENNPGAKQLKKNAEKQKKARKKGPKSITADPRKDLDTPPKSKICDKGSRKKK